MRSISYLEALLHWRSCGSLRLSSLVPFKAVVSRCTRGRIGPKVPLTLKFQELPYAVTGVLLLAACGVVLLARLVLANPTYQLLRLTFTHRQLPRVPKWRLLRIVTWTFAALGCTGALLIMLQYFAI